MAQESLEEHRKRAWAFARAAGLNALERLLGDRRIHAKTTLSTLYVIDPSQN